MTGELKRLLADSSREAESLAERIKELERDRDRWKAEANKLAIANATMLGEKERLRIPVPTAKPAPPPKPPALPVPTFKPDRDLPLPVDFPTRAVTLGLDFGTSSTKLVLQVRGDEKKRNWIPFLDEPSNEDACPPFAMPSLVRLVDGRLFFGRQAASLTGGQLFRSLKVDILPPSETGRWEQDQYPVGTTPQLLVAYYLSWVMGRVRRLLGKRLDRQFAMNIAAPMNHVENAALLESYLPIVNAAWTSSLEDDAGAAVQGVEAAVLRPRFQALLEREVLSPRNRRFYVFPETLAPIVSRLQDADNEQGLRVMVDMRAGTTEFSVSMVTSDGADRYITCYADRSILLGGDQFNAINGHALRELALRQELLKEFRRTFDEGYKKDMNNGRAARLRWSDVEVMLSGGGLRRPGLEEAIRADNRPASYELPSPRYVAWWHKPGRLTPIGVAQGYKFADYSMPFLAVAHGLSLESGRWHRFAFPTDVTALDGGHVESVWWRPDYLLQDE